MAFVGATGISVRARARVSFCKRDEKQMPKDVANPVDKHVGAKLRARRTKLGMSQSILAEALGLTFQQVQKYEKGVNRIGAGAYSRLPKYCKCRLNLSSKASRTNAASAVYQPTFPTCNM
jgi:DNA-binding XRE family transcriptional regulator